METVGECQRFKKKGPEPVQQVTTLKVLIDRLMTELAKFSQHLFVFRWQYQQFKLCRASIPTCKSLGLVVLDFAENFTCRPQDEVQSAYYGYTQITVHPSVAYYACPHPECSEEVIEYMVFLSDDLNHDAAMAQTILDKTVQHLKSRAPGLQQLAVFSDGCAAQYKSKLPFFYMSDMKSPVEIVRAYFGSRHGKSPCDACGGVVKRAVEEDILSRQAFIKDAKTMFEHCVNMHSLPEEPSPTMCCHKRRVFFLVQEEDVDRSMPSSELQTVDGTRKLHSLRRVRKNVIETRNLSCFCSPCLEKRDVCINTKYVEPWKTVNIKHTVPVSSDSSSISKEIDPDSDTDASDSLSVDDGILNKAFIKANQSLEISKCVVVPLESREAFFSDLQKQFSDCNSYEDLRELVAASRSSILSYKLPSITPKCLYDVGQVDHRALKDLPRGLEHIYPVATEADGNCVPRTFSLLVFGDQEHHTEIRCRIVLELVENSKDYLSLGDEVEILCQLSDFYGVEPEQVFQLETLDVSRPCRYMGIWQIMAAANVFQAPVFSIYPSSQEADFYKLFYDRTVTPRNPKTKQALLILWTSTRDDVKINHAVPLMPLTNCDEIVVT